MYLSQRTLLRERAAELGLKDAPSASTDLSFCIRDGPHCRYNGIEGELSLRKLPCMCAGSAVII